jgi:hypothetical protein
MHDALLYAFTEEICKIPITKCTVAFPLSACTDNHRIAKLFYAKFGTQKSEQIVFVFRVCLESESINGHCTQRSTSAFARRGDRVQLAHFSLLNFLQFS